MEIGKRIKHFRINRNITLEQPASQTGFTKGYLSKVERSGKSPPASNPRTIARIFGVTVSSIPGEEGGSRPICRVKKRERPRRKLNRSSGNGTQYFFESFARSGALKAIEREHVKG
jgi:transcriptional regulator with XRE-family HTH domain